MDQRKEAVTLKPVVRILWCLLAAEICGAVFFVVRWLREPIPPEPALTYLHPETQSELRTLRQRVVVSGDAAAWRDLGEAYLLFGLPRQAEFCCRQAAERNLATTRTLYLWGLALHQQGKTSEAIEQFQRAADLTPSDADGLFDRSKCRYAIGRNLLREEQTSEAEAAFRKAGDFPPARHQLARILVRSKRTKEAVALLDAMIARYPVAAKLYQLRAEARDAQGNASGAAADRRKAGRCIEFLPSDFIVQELHQEMKRFGLPRALQTCQEQLRNGQFETAAKRLRSLLAARWQTQIAMLLAECELRLHRGAAAVKLADRLIETEGVSLSLLHLKAQGLLISGRERDAIETWKRSLRIQSTEEVHRRLAGYFAKTKDAASEKHHRSRMLQARGVAAYRADRIADAVEDLQQAVAIDPVLDQAWYYLAACHLAGGMRQRAEDALAKCLKANPNHGRALRLVAEIQSAR